MESLKMMQRLLLPILVNKGIKRKNLYPIEGKALIQYTIDAAKESQRITRFIVNSDDEEIIDYALDLGITNAFCQEDETVSESFIPSFNFEGVKRKQNI